MNAHCILGGWSLDKSSAYVSEHKTHHPLARAYVKVAKLRGTHCELVLRFLLSPTPHQQQVCFLNAGAVKCWKAFNIRFMKVDVSQDSQWAMLVVVLRQRTGCSKTRMSDARSAGQLRATSKKSDWACVVQDFLLREWQGTKYFVLTATRSNEEGDKRWVVRDLCRQENEIARGCRK